MIISKKMTDVVQFSVGVCVFNEEKNIAGFIKAVLGQNLSLKIKLKEIIVVASGCTDNTVKITKNLQRKYKKIRLIVEDERNGKVSAVNIFIASSKTNFLILQSADTRPSKNCYKMLLRELTKYNVGLTAGQIIPEDNPETFLGYSNCLRWKLHHLINMKYPDRPKVGELIAFRKIFERIAPKAFVDEASVEPLIHLQGYKIVYVPKALIYNQGPKTLREYLSRRRSIYAGHYITKRRYAYEVITYNVLRILPIFVSNLDLRPKYLIYSLGSVLLELAARIAGYLDVKLKLRDQSIWKIAETTKDLN